MISLVHFQWIFAVTDNIAFLTGPVCNRPYAYPDTRHVQICGTGEGLGLWYDKRRTYTVYGMVGMYSQHFVSFAAFPSKRHISHFHSFWPVTFIITYLNGLALLRSRN